MLFITEKSLTAWLNQLLIDHAVIAPVKSANDLTLFQPVASPEVIFTKSQNTALSPKDWFFPRREAIMTFITENGKTRIIPARMEKDAVIFGIRPCDARAISLTDRPFLAEPVDALYQERRDRTTLVGLACVTVCQQCFCTSMGSGPADPKALDILLTPVDGGFAAQVVTERGKRLLDTAITQEKELVIPRPPEVSQVPSAGITEAMRRTFNHIYWDRVADRCIHCNICSFVCPCCYCFDIRDYKEKDGIKRVRSWESCESALFTRAAGGHNPRPSKGARMRQRFAHKLLYFPDIFGELKCTGCGRCVRNCPVNIDIREVISDVQKLAKE
ncbi:MAG: 4Fe-4S dicluster domain-containing protein [Dehalococcoidia bacterium]|nr:4Fe-4S dicluster domain-containing protein [Dehalococcoidia bacterium]